MKIVKLTVTSKNKSDRTGRENNDAEYTLFRKEIIIETIEKTEAISMNVKT